MFIFKCFGYVKGRQTVSPVHESYIWFGLKNDLTTCMHTVCVLQHCAHCNNAISIIIIIRIRISQLLEYVKQLSISIESEKGVEKAIRRGSFRKEKRRKKKRKLQPTSAECKEKEIFEQRNKKKAKSYASNFKVQQLVTA